MSLDRHERKLQLDWLAEADSSEVAILAWKKQAISRCHFQFKETVKRIVHYFLTSTRQDN